VSQLKPQDSRVHVQGLSLEACYENQT